MGVVVGRVRPTRPRGRRPASPLLALLALATLVAIRLAGSWASRALLLALAPVLAVGIAGLVGAAFLPGARPLARPPDAPPAGAPSPGARAQEGCRIAPGFTALRDLIPAVVGECVEDERPDPLTADAAQRTAGGLLVRRAADGAVAFTDGRGTWLHGPDGPAYRPNTVRLPWEANPAGLPVVAPGHPSLAPPGALLPAQRVVAYYGHPLSPAMGVLGQGPPEPMLAALEREAQRWTAADPTTPARPALHLVATVATGTPARTACTAGGGRPEVEQVAQWAPAVATSSSWTSSPGAALGAPRWRPSYPTWCALTSTWPSTRSGRWPPVRCRDKRSGR